MKVKNTLSLTIGSLTFNEEPKALEASSTEDGPKMRSLFPQKKAGLQVSDLKLDIHIDEELSDAEFEANMKLAQTFFQGLATAVPAVIKEISELEDNKARLRHYHKVEEMKLADQLDAAKHQRIQESKGNPDLVEKIVTAMAVNNEQLCKAVVEKVRGY